MISSFVGVRAAKNISACELCCVLGMQRVASQLTWLLFLVARRHRVQEAGYMLQAVRALEWADSWAFLWCCGLWGPQVTTSLCHPSILSMFILPSECGTGHTADTTSTRCCAHGMRSGWNAVGMGIVPWASCVHMVWLTPSAHRQAFSPSSGLGHARDMQWFESPWTMHTCSPCKHAERWRGSLSLSVLTFCGLITTCPTPE